MCHHACVVKEGSGHTEEESKAREMTQPVKYKCYKHELD